MTKTLSGQTPANINQPWMPDKPAFSGLFPESLVWQGYADLSIEWQQLGLSLIKQLSGHLLQNSLSENLTKDMSDSSLIEALKDGSMRFLRLQSHHDFPFGFYRLVMDDVDWFIKLVTTEQAERQLQANKTPQWLGQQQNTESFWQTSPLVLEQTICIDVVDSRDVSVLISDYSHGRFLQPKLADIEVLAMALAELHQILPQQPNVDEVKQLGLQRQQFIKQHLLDLQQQLRETNDSFNVNYIPESLQKTLLGYDADKLDCLLENAQAIHGDLNVGNIWLSDTNTLLFLDFEDSLSAWFNPIMDLAYILERLILVQVDSDERKQLLSSVLLQTYLANNRDVALNDSVITDILQALAIRALVLLLLNVKDTTQSVSDEWQKFVYLFDLAEKHRVMFKQITAKSQTHS